MLKKMVIAGESIAKEEGFTSNWTEVFTISSVKATKPPTYTIKDTLGEPFQGTFYEQ